VEVNGRSVWRVNEKRGEKNEKRLPYIYTNIRVIGVKDITKDIDTRLLKGS